MGVLREATGLRISEAAPAGLGFGCGGRGSPAARFASWWRRLAALLILTWLSWPGALDAQGQRLKFLVFSDTISFENQSGINTNILAELAAAAVSEQPQFVLFGGDFGTLPGQSTLQTWTNLMGPLYQAGIPVFPALGNHDTSDLAAFTNVFGTTIPANGPEGELGSTYALAWSNALIIVLNEFISTNQYEVQQAWLEAVLATNTLPHVFALGHLPAFKVFHVHGLDAFPANRDRFWNTLSNAHCRLYFCGHDHFYDHLRLDDGDGNPDNDLHQFIVGAGGAPLYPDGPYDGNNGSWTPVRVFHEQQFGYLAVEMDRDIVRATWHHRTGTNAYAATPEVLAYSLAPRPRLQFGFSARQLVLTWTGDALLEAASDLAGPFTNVPAATSPFSVPTASDGRVFYRLVRP